MSDAPARRPRLDRPFSVPRLGAATALLVLLALVGLDLVIPPSAAVLTPMFGLAPLVACAVVPARGTALLASLATGAAILSGWWNGAWGTAQQGVRILDVALVGGAAVIVAAVRVRRERQYAEVAKIAQVAQRAILPILPARAGDVAIASRYQSAARGAMVGGDLFDCYHSQDHVRLLIGDVRGKGIEGVEQAARVIRAFRQSAALHADLAEVANEMDDYLAGFFQAEEFVTALLVDVTESGVLQLVSAGHPGPQLVRSSDTEMLDLPAGLPLGLGLGRLSESYEVAEVPWGSGDRLLMYTDGLSEARDAGGRFFDVTSVAGELRSGSVGDALDHVLTRVSSHVPRGRLEDDLALVVVEHLPVLGPVDSDLVPAREPEQDLLGSGPWTPSVASSAGPPRPPARRRSPTSPTATAVPTPVRSCGAGCPSRTTRRAARTARCC